MDLNLEKSACNTPIELNRSELLTDSNLAVRAAYSKSSDARTQEPAEQEAPAGSNLASIALALGGGLLSARFAPSRSLCGDIVRSGFLAGSLGIVDLLSNHPKTDKHEQVSKPKPGTFLGEQELFALRFAAAFAGGICGRRMFGEPLSRLAGRLESSYASHSLNKTNCLLAGPEDFLRDLRSLPPECDRFSRCKFLACGRDSVALSQDGKVLKLSWKPFPSIERPFDVPVFERGKLTDKIYYRLEAKVEMNARWLDEMPFKKLTEDLGYPGLDIHKGNIGTYKGRLVLIDPFHF